ncbi:hypothetical protein DB42_CR00200 [Neochlamydia sp. EPS4]|uniref:hypothetical protein n=1 Tax=Neochlamydia sp. EPS4 TaxID=1478175 RepID=UPI0005826331|nr:hypothetical protein [Neochlamydia sp. EPS4]KIC72862.1 hypothetical protein DB42_CR00200 [Neochlamydia sp. EPS4]
MENASPLSDPSAHGLSIYSSSSSIQTSLNASQASKPHDKIEAVFQSIKTLKDNRSPSFQSDSTHTLSAKHEIWELKTSVLSEVLHQESSPHVTIQQATSGTNGCYIIKYNFEGKKIEGVFKPINETEKTRKGIPANQQATREYLGYMLSQYLTASLIKKGIKIEIQNFGVPPTSIATVDKTISILEEGQIGSFQKFKKGIPLADLENDTLMNIHINELMKMLVIDIIMLNTDRHLGNAFLTDKGSIVLIDQGSTFPGLDSLKKGKTNDNLGFDWMFINFTKEKIPVAWHELILSIPPRELYTNLVESLNELQSIHPHSSDLNISGNVLFNSMTSLLFLQHWVKNAGQELPSRELLRCFISERIPYLYAVKKDASKEITTLQAQSIHNFERNKNTLANTLDNDLQEGKSGYYATDPVFLTVVKEAWKEFESTLPPKERGEISPKTFLDHWESAEQIVSTKLTRLTFKETNQLAREYFSAK